MKGDAARLIGRSLSGRCAARLALLLLPTTVLRPSPAAAGGYTIRRLGLAGAQYQSAGAGGVKQDSEIVKLVASGAAAGESTTYKASGGLLGKDGWLFDGASTVVLGLAGATYESATPAGLLRNTQVGSMNNLLQVVGDSGRYKIGDDVFASLGSDAWRYSNGVTQLISLSGPEYERAAAGGEYRYGSATFINDAGQSVGLNFRYGASGVDMGNEAWFFDGASTLVVSPNDVEHQYTTTAGTYRYAFCSLLNNSGQTGGWANRFNAAGENLGADTWFYDGTTTQIIGLTGGLYEYNVSGGLYRAGAPPQAINDAGQVIGFSFRWNSSGENRGTDCFFFDGTTSRLVGLEGPDYEVAAADGVPHRFTQVSPLLTNSGMTAGRTVRFSDATDVLGQDVWLFDGDESRLASLTGPGYEYATLDGVYRVAGALGLNEAGQMVGGSLRYTTGGTERGQAGWFFDVATGVTTPLEFSVRANDGYSFTEPFLLTPQGVVVGKFELFVGNASQGEHLFSWTLAGGMQDLGTLAGLVDGGIAAAGWQSLTHVSQVSGPLAGGLPKYLAGTGLVIGQDASAFAGDSVFLLTSTAAGGTFLPGDFNEDTDVDDDDLAAWRTGLGTTGSADHGDGDADGDHDVDGADFLIWQQQLGTVPTASAAVSAVPEPASALLALICLTLSRVAARAHRQQRSPTALHSASDNKVST